MNTIYRFATNAAWTEGRHGVVRGETGRPQLEFSAPPEFQGQAGFWTPEHFFLAAVATCFLTTFRAIAEFSKFDAEALEVGVEGTVEKGEGGFRFTRVVVRPLLTVHLEAFILFGMMNSVRGSRIRSNERDSMYRTPVNLPEETGGLQSDQCLLPCKL